MATERPDGQVFLEVLKTDFGLEDPTSEIVLSEFLGLVQLVLVDKPRSVVSPRLPALSLFPADYASLLLNLRFFDFQLKGIFKLNSVEFSTVSQMRRFISNNYGRRDACPRIKTRIGIRFFFWTFKSWFF